jgi:hypothetical protein
VEHEKETMTIERIPLGLLNISYADPGPGYQRAANERRIRKISANWDWDMMEPLVVSIRQGQPDEGSYFVVDGQHRFLAALRVFGEDQEVPCIIVHMTLDQEALRFARQNENRRNVHTRDLFRAKIQANDPEALDIKDAVETAGWTIGYHHGPSRGHSITALSGLQGIYRYFGREILLRALRVARDAYPVGMDSRADIRVISGIAHFLYHFPVVNEEKLIEKLSMPEATPRRLLQRATTYSITSGMGRGNPQVSRVILDQYNKGRSTHRLDWDLNKYRVQS